MKFRLVLLNLLFIAVGCCIGWFACARMYKKGLEDHMKTTAAVGVAQNFDVLRALRAGETDRAIEDLEAEMDGNVTTLGLLIGDLPATKRRPSDIRLLTRVREYRTSHPRKTDYPNIDQAVADSLSLGTAEGLKSLPP